MCVCVYFTPGSSEDTFDRFIGQLLHSTTPKWHLPPIQMGQHHIFSAEHTTRDILSLMAQVQGLNMPSKSSNRKFIPGESVKGARSQSFTLWASVARWSTASKINNKYHIAKDLQDFYCLKHLFWTSFDKLIEIAKLVFFMTLAFLVHNANCPIWCNYFSWHRGLMGNVVNYWRPEKEKFDYNIIIKIYSNLNELTTTQNVLICIFTFTQSLPCIFLLPLSWTNTANLSTY